MAKVGELLVQMGACSEVQIREALANQVIFGGRIGTNLLELGSVTEEQLAQALGKKHGLPFAFGAQEPDRTVVNLLRPDQVDKLEAIPFRFDERKLRVLVCDPQNLAAMDQIAFATGKKITPVVVPEARMWLLMRSLYGVDRQLRGLDVDFGRLETQVASPTAVAPVDASSGMDVDLISQEEFQALLNPELRSGAPIAAQPPPPASPAAPRPAQIRPPTSPAAPRPAQPPPPVTPAAPRPAQPPPPVSPTAPRPTQVRPPTSPAAPRPTQPPPPFSPAAPATRPAPPPAARVAPPTAPSTVQMSATVAHPAAPAPSGPRGPMAPAGFAPPDRPAPPMVMPPPEDELPLIELVAEEEVPVAPVEPPPIGFDEALQLLSGVEDRTAIAQTVLRYARSRFKRAVLVTVNRGWANGWEGLGEGLSLQSVRRLRVDLKQPSAFKTCIESRAHFLGPLQKNEAHIRFLRALGRGAPKNVFLLPVLALERVVNVLYADNGRGGYVDADLGELLILATRIAKSYDSLLSRVG